MQNEHLCVLKSCSLWLATICKLHTIKHKQIPIANNAAEAERCSWIILHFINWCHHGRDTIVCHLPSQWFCRRRVLDSKSHHIDYTAASPYVHSHHTDAKGSTTSLAHSNTSTSIFTTGWLKLKYPTGQNAISPLPCKIFMPKFLDLYGRHPTKMSDC